MENFECRICTETVPSAQCFKTRPSRACFSSFCTYCIAKYIEVEVSNNTASILCPLKASCKNHILDPFKCKRLISQALFDRWCDILCELAIRGLERCHCPNMACWELIVDECNTTGDVWKRKVTCPNCKKSCCFRCSSPWQEDHRCSRGDKDYLPRGNNWKRCPGCRNYVEHVGGCYIIRCRCGILFCYYCGSPWNYLHKCRRSLPVRALEVSVFIGISLCGIFVLGLSPWFCIPVSCVGHFFSSHH